MTLALEIAEGNYLRPNGLGGYLISYSQLSSWGRCQLQKFYEDRAKADPDAPQPKQLSVTAYGSVMHYVLMLLQQWIIEGREDALKQAQAAFEFYWQPENIDAICPRVNEWLPRETYGGLRERGRRALADMYDLLQKDEMWLLGLEYEFHVPMVIRGRTHTVRGMIDRLGIKKAARKPYLMLDDFKFGRKPSYLRFHQQFSFYAWASTLPEFWQGWPDSGLGELEHFDDETIGRLDRLFSSWGYALHRGSDAHREQDPPLRLAARRGRWVSGKETAFSDAGYRNERDYARIHLGVDAYVRSCEAEIYNTNSIGEICRFCSFKDSCGGVGLPHEEAGAP